MSLSFDCDAPICDKEKLDNNEVVQVAIQILDPESGPASVRKQFCIADADAFVSALAEIGISLEA